MMLSNNELKKIWFGAYEFAEAEDGYLQAFQHTKEQIAYFKSVSDSWYPRSMASACKTLELMTEAEAVSFDYKLIWVASRDTFEVAVNDLICDVKYIRDIEREGRLCFHLPAGMKKVTIYLPADSTAVIRNFDVDAPIVPVVKGEKVLWIGDSITQGYGPLRSACTYVSVVNRILGYDIINQGVGGYVYDKNGLMKMDGYRPDKIIVALGTNQFRCGTEKPVEEFYEKLSELYGSNIKVLCITPLWRGDVSDQMDNFIWFCESIKKVAGRYTNISIVDGFKLVPHLQEYFLDKLHPNCLGSEIYGRNLVREIERLGF